MNRAIPTGWASRGTRALCLVGLVSLAVGAGPALAQDRAVGRVKVLEGAVFVVRGGQVLTARLGDTLDVDDTLRTGEDGRLGVILRDDTRLSLGPSSEVRIDRFAFAPAQGRLELLVRVARGLILYVSGKIAELSPDAVSIQTPAAIVGIRGTRFAARIEGE